MSRRKTAREVALDVLVRIERDEAYSNLLLNRVLEQAGLPRQDKALATELVYGTVQRRNTIDFVLNRFVGRGVERLDPWVRNLLRLSYYQMAYLDRIPDHAIVHEAVNIAKKRGHQGISGMVNGVLRNMARQPEKCRIPPDLDPVSRFALIHSHPEWLVEKWIRFFGEETAAAMCEANNRPPRPVLRLNALKMDRDTFLEKMRIENRKIMPSPLHKFGFIVLDGGNPALDSGYEEGLFSIQDMSSMLVAEIVAPKPGMTVLDCCAAPGGKATHLAEIMQDRGVVWANDIHAHKARLVRDQAARLGLRSVRALAGDAARLGERFADGTFDRILLDAPCSGLGVIRRKPDVKWRKRPADILEMAKLQIRLLRAAAPLLKPGGVLVYSTCTLEYTENEQVVQTFLREFPGFEPDEEVKSLVPEELAERNGHAMPGTIRILPHWFDSDGFFVCRMRRIR